MEWCPKPDPLLDQINARRYDPANCSRTAPVRVWTRLDRLGANTRVGSMDGRRIARHLQHRRGDARS